MLSNIEKNASMLYVIKIFWLSPADWCNLLWENFESETEQFDSFDKRSEIKLKCSGIKTCQYYRWYVWFYTLTLHLEEILLVLVSTTTLITYYICPSSQSPPSTSWPLTTINMNTITTITRQTLLVRPIQYLRIKNTGSFLGLDNNGNYRILHVYLHVHRYKWQ